MKPRHYLLSALMSATLATLDLALALAQGSGGGNRSPGTGSGDQATTLLPASPRRRTT
jgi:hypothetical protein